jgi:NAD-dependent DNA ligase
VSAKTTALIAGEEPGNSKLTKAQKVGTAILNEQELLELLDSN